MNFRDDDTGIPRNWSDEDFVKAIHSLDLTDDGAASWFEAWSDGEYGYWHDWGADPDGSRVLQLIGESRGDIARDIRTAETTGDGRVQASPTRKTGPSDEQLARWRADYEGLLRKYSGDSLKRLEAAVNRQAAGQTLFQTGTGRGRDQSAATSGIGSGGLFEGLLRAADFQTNKQYGSAREHSVSVLGFHFGHNPREMHDSAFYGGGMKGAEAERLMGSQNDDIRPRPARPPNRRTAH